jgi:hypothetical protein
MNPGAPVTKIRMMMSPFGPTNTRPICVVYR